MSSYRPDNQREPNDRRRFVEPNITKYVVGARKIYYGQCRFKRRNSIATTRVRRTPFTRSSETSTIAPCPSRRTIKHARRVRFNVYRHSVPRVNGRGIRQPFDARAQNKHFTWSAVTFTRGLARYAAISPSKGRNSTANANTTARTIMVVQLCIS